MTIGDPRYGSGDPSSYGMRRRPGDLPTPQTASRAGRRTGGVDPATVAIALSGMTMYWLLPAMLSRGGRRRRRTTQRTSQSQ